MAKSTSSVGGGVGLGTASRAAGGIGAAACGAAEAACCTIGTSNGPGAFTGVPFYILILKPSRSSSNSLSSCSRTMSRMRLISSKSMRLCESRWEVCEHFDPVRRHKYVVFDPHAAPPWEIGARFDGEDHSRLDRFVSGRRRESRLYDAVAGWRALDWAVPLNTWDIMVALARRT